MLRGHTVDRGDSFVPNSCQRQKTYTHEHGARSAKKLHWSGSDRLTPTDSHAWIPIAFKRGVRCRRCGFQTYPCHFPTVPHPDCVALASPSTLSPCCLLGKVAAPNGNILPGCGGRPCAVGCESTVWVGRQSVCMWLKLAVGDQTVILCACLAEGCPGLCNGNGRCTLDLNGWHCVCQLGWRGAGCDTSMETACGDNKDNDGGKAVAPAGWEALHGGWA